MLNRIIDFSLRNRLIVLACTLLLLLIGTWITLTMDIDIFPELTAPTVVIMTEAQGMSPEEVERLITFPIETAINGSTSIRRVRSNSSMGFSIVWAEFDWGTDIYRARQTVTERLYQVSEQLPADAGKPVLAPQSSLLGEMMIIAVTSDSLNPMDLRTFAGWSITPRLLSIPGVAQVHVIGGDEKEYQILADPLKMNYYNVSIDELLEACRNINENSPGGFINQHGNKYIVRGIGRTSDPGDIAAGVIKTVNNQPVKIGNVAEVTIGSSPKIGTASYNGHNAVLITVTRQPHANSVKLAGEIIRVTDEIQKNAGNKIVIHTGVYNQAAFIKTAINNVLKALTEGGIFVILILFIFLFNFRTTFISVLAIPFSLLVSVLTLRLLGYTINTMSLGGMAIAIGSLVDDAIIDVENSWKQLRLNALKHGTEKEHPLRVILRASVEMRSSIVNATAVIIVTFLPLFLLEGFEGRMLKPLGIAFIVSLFASMVIAITVTPVLCSYLLTNEKRLLKLARGAWVERNLTSAYKKVLEPALKRPGIIIASAATLLAVSVIMLVTSGSSFLPPFNEGALTVNIGLMPGTSIEESDKIGRMAEEILLGIPEVKAVSRKTGRAELAEHSFGENFSELDVPFELRKRSRADFFADVRSRLAKLPGASVEVGQPITHRIDNMLSGSKANIAIKIFGDDLNVLYNLAQEIKHEISDIKGIADLTVEQQVETPQLKIKPRRELLAMYGIPAGKFTSFIRCMLGGETISEVYEEEKRFPMVVRYNDETRASIEGIKSSLIDTHDGRKIPLTMVAEIESSSGPYSINRENVQRRIVISVNVSGSDQGTVAKNIRNRIEKNITLPVSYRIEYSGQFENAARAARRLLLASVAALIAVFMILYNEFRKKSLALIILLNLPLALIGGFFAVKLSSGVVSIPAIIGFITLTGIATRNGILLVSRYTHLKEEGVPIKERIIRGSADRLNPILMTALTAAFALIPLALGGDKAGNEIQSPMAVVILGGLLSSTLLNLFVVPAVYSVAEKNSSQENAKSE
ncbi:MAG TPA: efflux RND transporter permease subunit [Bacteroidales bacterium]|nr:efflux RND transporter permease subunit [Bacteroidales bacterium]HOK75237.1 efflux RND transporter permease subunit [Bacteroidales bacterium]HOM40684.1 efflux RND transporter permease subunit [Bacteroidales bacterium]HPP92360.1 efflux RND transporter permease subunit [Bacteroidales bacterium]HRR16667.1 efflux RND transporter permease subunit [Bacteroidales bacterium]